MGGEVRRGRTGEERRGRTIMTVKAAASDSHVEI